jgi:NADP-dependent 3-hydroxy acid dehydrogenase YdfG
MFNKKILIIGGTSSLNNEIVKKAKEVFTEITCTYRNKDKIFDNVCNWEYLNLEEDNSINLFLDKTLNQEYDTIILLIGSTTNKKYTDISIDDIKKYHEINSGSYIYLLQNLTSKIKDNGQIIVVSSRSANHASYDIHYSAVKSSIQSAVKSLSKFLKNNQSMICIAPSLIHESKMYNEMTEENIKRHLYLSNDSLITKSEFADFIISLNNKITKLVNGQTISVGNY